MAMRISDQKAKKGGGLSRRTKVDLLCFLVIIIVGTFFFMNEGSGDDLFWDETQLILTMPDEAVYTIPFSEITHVALVENADFGVCLTGEEAGNRRYGIWQNDLLGEYVLSAYEKTETVMHIATMDEDYWIALESNDTTAAFTDAFITMLKDAGYDLSQE